MAPFILFALLQFLFVIFLFRINQRRSRGWNRKRIAFYATVFFYFSLIAIALALKYYGKQAMDSGFLGTDMQTIQQQESLENLSAKNAFFYIPIIGLVYSIIYLVFLLILFAVASVLKKRSKPAQY